MTAPLLQSPDLEEALVGAVLINPSQYPLLDVSMSDFVTNRMRTVWGALSDLSLDHAAIDYLTVCDVLSRSGQLSAAGGEAGIAALFNHVPNSTNAQEYARRIRDLAYRRKLLTFASEIARLAQDLDVPPLDVLPAMLDELWSGTRAPRSTVAVGDWVDETMQEIAAAFEIHQAGDQAGGQLVLKTGLVDVDRMTGGFFPSDGTVWVIAGRAGIGKTILMTTIAESYAAQASGALISQEMKRGRLTYRMLAQLSGVPVWEMRTGRMDGENHWRDVSQAEVKLRSLPLHVSDNAWTTGAMMAELARLKHDHGIRWFALDYLGLLLDPREEGERKAGWLERMASRMVRICRDLELHGVILHTVNASGELSGEETLKNHVDAACVLEDGKFGGMVNVKFIKLRDGESGLGNTQLTIIKNPTRPRFENAIAKDNENGHKRDPVQHWADR